MVNGNLTAILSGEADWEMETIEVPEGEHIIRWEYVKDSSVSEGLDAAFLDEVVWTPAGGFENWAVIEELPEDRRAPTDRNGPLNWPNVLAYAMGVNPLTATREDMPHFQGVDSAEGVVYFRYLRAKNASGVELVIRGSTNLTDRIVPNVLSSTVIEDLGDNEWVEVSIEIPESSTYFLWIEAVY